VLSDVLPVLAVMLQFLDNLIHYQDPTLPAFSHLAYLFILILLASFLISARSEPYTTGEVAN
jgi:hypothetical protein